MIKYFNRKNKQYEIEQVAGEKYLNWCYQSPIGLGLLETLVKKKLFSNLYGAYCDNSMSKSKINSFITGFNLDMSICKKKVEEFTSFNDFFYRELKPEARPMSKDKNMLISPGDGKLLAFENIDMNNIIQVKGFTYSLAELIKDPEIAAKYQGGTCLVLRLCPTDYHRFHFPDSGVCSAVTKIDGYYYSVNPVALEKIQKLFCQNKREWSTLHSDNFGDIIYMEVGATGVGSIVQTYTPNTYIEKGAEKGYFKFGGSTTILFFEANKVKIDEDIVSQTLLGFETSIVMGETIGRKI